MRSERPSIASAEREPKSGQPIVTKCSQPNLGEVNKREAQTGEYDGIDI
jgi:hypothetical protein